MQQHHIGRTSVTVTQMGLGGTGLGNMYTAVEEQAAFDTIAEAYALGIRHFDTAPVYGNGLSEMRLGQGLSRYVRDDVTISTKAGYTLEPLPPGEQSWDLFQDSLPFRSYVDFSRDAILRSLSESLERLRTDRLDIVWMHDPDEANSIKPGADPYEVTHFARAMDEAYPALDELRSQGIIGAIGVGMNQWQMLEDFARAGDFDCFLLAGRYTLLEQSALGSFLPLCTQKNISVVIGGPYSSGILATGAVNGAYYNYAPAPESILERVRQIEAVCHNHRVALPAAALQFPLAHPAVVSVIPGARSVAELRQNIAHFRAPIPSQLWAELKSLGLIDGAAPVPTEEQGKE